MKCHYKMLDFFDKKLIGYNRRRMNTYYKNTSV